jgi:hypothetical protein
LTKVNQKNPRWNPKFGSDHGYTYPAIWHILNGIRSITPSKWLPTSNATDLYILFWWVIEATYLIALTDWLNWRAWVLCAIFLYRITDIFLTQMTLLIGPKEWASSQRLVLLLLLNAIELMIIYGALYWIFNNTLPILGAFSQKLNGFFECFYFSVVTATTLGYGSPHPIGTIARLVSMVESMHLLLIIVTLISYVRSSNSNQTDPMNNLQSRNDRIAEPQNSADAKGRAAD